MQCRIVKNTLLQTAFVAILPTGKSNDYNKNNTKQPHTKTTLSSKVWFLLIKVHHDSFLHSEFMEIIILVSRYTQILFTG